MTEICFFIERDGEHCYHDGTCCECGKVAPGIPTSRILDQFGYEIPSEPTPAVSVEDLELCKRFLSKLKDQTLSRSMHRVLSDLIGRLP